MIGYLLEVQAVNAVGMSSKIFVYHRGSVNPDTGEFQDIYEAVASPAQMDEIPPDAPYSPDGLTQVPYYRTDLCQFVTRTVEELDELWTIIQEDVADLVDCLNKLATLQTPETVDFP